MRYVETALDVEAPQLDGFFEGWPNPPSPRTHLRLLRNSSHVVLAIDASGQVVGFITAVSDGVLTAYISFLEVRPSHRRQGVGTQLVQRLLRQLSGFYAINLHCDPDLEPFYAGLGLSALGGMALRNYSCQAGTHAA